MNITTKIDFTRALEVSGFKREIAGKQCFGKAVRALELMQQTRKGLFVYGTNGVGKTCFCRAVDKVFGLGATFVRLLDPTQLPLITDEYFLDRLFGGGAVILDDVGSEHQRNDYGVVCEPVSDFIGRWYEKYEKHLSIGNLLVVNTNLSAEQFAARYSMRTVSRLKSLCCFWKMEGEDKRFATVV